MTKNSKIQALLAMVSLALVVLLSVSFPAPAAGERSPAEEFLAEVNLARTHPQRYAAFVKELRGRFEGKNLRLPGSATLLRTTEGVGALDEAVTYLFRQKVLPPLVWSPGLARAAAELVHDQGEAGGVGHKSQSGGVSERIERQGDWEHRIGENVAYGPRTARFIVLELIIDDGVPGRGHRKNIFTPDFAVAGAACGPHPVYGTMCAMDFAGGFTGKKP